RALSGQGPRLAGEAQRGYACLVPSGGAQRQFDRRELARRQLSQGLQRVVAETLPESDVQSIEPFSHLGQQLQAGGGVERATPRLEIGAVVGSPSRDSRAPLRGRSWRPC